MEKFEKYIIFGLIAAVVLWLYSKGKAAQNVGTQPAPTTGGLGSIVNQLEEVFKATPAQTSTPVLYAPAQPSTVPMSTRVGVVTVPYRPPSTIVSPSNITASNYAQLGMAQNRLALDGGGVRRVLL